MNFVATSVLNPNSALNPKLETITLPEIEIRPDSTKNEEERDEDLDSDTPWNVVLLDDNFHTYNYVIEMLMNIFGYNGRKALRMALEVDFKKRVIVWSGHLERAEAYQGEIHAYGADPRMETSQGPMSAILEKAR